MAKQQKQQTGNPDAAHVWASAVQSEKIKWLWQDRIPQGKISLIAGRPDQGKGLFVAHLAADVSRKGGAVIYSAVEDDVASMTRPRLEAADANLDNIMLFRFHLPEMFNDLANRIIDHDIRLVVMDPFAPHLLGVHAGSSEIRHKVLTPLSDLASDTGCSFVVVEHTIKNPPKSAQPLNAIRGNSSGLPAAARMGFVFGSDPDDPDRKILANVKHNIAPKRDALQFEVDIEDIDGAGEVPCLINQGRTVFDESKLLHGNPGDGTPGRKPDRRASAAEWLTQYMVAAYEAGTAPVRAGDVQEDAKQYGISKNTLRRAVADMGIVKSAAGGPNVTWDLPDEVKDALGVVDGGGDDE